MNYIHDISGKQFCVFEDKSFLKVGKQKCGFAYYQKEEVRYSPTSSSAFLFCLASIEYRHE